MIVLPAAVDVEVFETVDLVIVHTLLELAVAVAFEGKDPTHANRLSRDEYSRISFIES